MTFWGHVIWCSFCYCSWNACMMFSLNNLHYNCNSSKWRTGVWFVAREKYYYIIEMRLIWHPFNNFFILSNWYWSCNQFGCNSNCSKKPQKEAVCCCICSPSAGNQTLAVWFAAGSSNAGKQATPSCIFSCLCFCLQSPLMCLTFFLMDVKFNQYSPYVEWILWCFSICQWFVLGFDLWQII